MNRFEIQRTVLFGDCDPGGVMYTPRFTDYVVEAVLAFQTSILGGPAARKLLGMGILPPARSISIEFMSPLTWDDQIVLGVACTNVGRTSFTCEVVARHLDQRIAFIGKITQVCISMATKTPVELPNELRVALA